jgi:hypothetical protein
MKHSFGTKFENTFENEKKKKMKSYLNAANMFVFMKKVNTKKFLFKKEMFICMT